MESVYCTPKGSSYSTVVESLYYVIIGYTWCIIMCSIVGSARYSNVVAVHCSIIRYV
jgi:hypothetical protein